MGVVSFLLFGLAAGLAARLVTPGRQSIGCLATIVVGIVGAFLGGLAGDVVLGRHIQFGWSPGPFLLAVVGAVLLLLLLESLAGRRRLRRPPVAASLVTTPGATTWPPTRPGAACSRRLPVNPRTA